MTRHTPPWYGMTFAASSRFGNHRFLGCPEKIFRHREHQIIPTCLEMCHMIHSRRLPCMCVCVFVCMRVRVSSVLLKGTLVRVLVHVRPCVETNFVMPVLGPALNSPLLGRNLPEFRNCFVFFFVCFVDPSRKMRLEQFYSLLEISVSKELAGVELSYLPSENHTFRPFWQG